jgi:hypothetical protein
VVLPQASATAAILVLSSSGSSSKEVLHQEELQGAHELNRAGRGAQRQSWRLLLIPRPQEWLGLLGGDPYAQVLCRWCAGTVCETSLHVSVCECTLMCWRGVAE